MNIAIRLTLIICMTCFVASHKSKVKQDPLEALYGMAMSASDPFWSLTANCNAVDAGSCKLGGYSYILDGCNLSKKDGKSKGTQGRLLMFYNNDKEYSLCCNKETLECSTTTDKPDNDLYLTVPKLEACHSWLSEVVKDPHKTVRFVMLVLEGIYNSDTTKLGKTGSTYWERVGLTLKNIYNQGGLNKNPEIWSSYGPNGVTWRNFALNKFDCGRSRFYIAAMKANHIIKSSLRKQRNAFISTAMSIGLSVAKAGLTSTPAGFALSMIEATSEFVGGILEAHDKVQDRKEGIHDMIIDIIMSTLNQHEVGGCKRPAAFWGTMSLWFSNPDHASMSKQIKSCLPIGKFYASDVSYKYKAVYEVAKTIIPSEILEKVSLEQIKEVESATTNLIASYTDSINDFKNSQETDERNEKLDAFLGKQ